MVLTAHDVVQVWEAGQRQPPAVQALTILAAAWPSRTWDDIARLPLRQRDSLLFGLRRDLLGPRLDSVVDCPECGTDLEFALDTTEIGHLDVEIEPGAPLTLEAGGQSIEYRLPDTTDIVAMSASADLDAARQTLLDRCVVRVVAGGQDAPLLPAGLDALALALDEQDAAADIEIDLLCPTCGHGWQVALEIATFFWTEVSAQARRLLREVDALARVYGWREADILAMSATRRRFYLEMVG